MNQYQFKITGRFLTGQTIDLFVNQDTKSYQIKEKIAINTNVQANNLFLYYETSEMEDNRTIFHYGIGEVEDEYIHIITGPVQEPIIIKKLTTSDFPDVTFQDSLTQIIFDYYFLRGRLVTGESNIFYVNSNMTISKLKHEVGKSIGVPVDQIRLVYGDNLLEDRQKIQFYKMREGDYFHILTTLVNFQIKFK